MSEEESNENSKNEENENEDKENEEGEGEEKEDEENEEGEEGEGEEKEDEEENEDDENEGEENEDDEEKEEEEDEEEDNKKKKKKGKGKKNEKKEEKGENEEETQNKFPETKLSPTKEIKMDLNLNLNNLNNSDNIFFNGNDITMANIIPKKSTLQLLMEISSDMDALTSHLEKVLPSPIKYNIDYKITNPIIDVPTMPIIQNYSLPPVPNYDQEDIEIKKLINKANEMTNTSILNKNNVELNNSMSNKEIKIFEDKGCQSDDEIENSYNKQIDDDRTQQEYYNNENNRNGSRFPYDPNKHLDYYNDLRNNNGSYEKKIPFSDSNRVRRMEDYYRGNNSSFRRSPIIYTQPESNQVRNYNKENNNKDLRYQRYRPGSITQAMDILLDKK